MLWLYITGFAVLIGAEVNFAIESTDRDQVSSCGKYERCSNRTLPEKPGACRTDYWG
jgi:uncharacterized BrkB/YihY/UPF0761 family membrane protein